MLRAKGAEQTTDQIENELNAEVCSGKLTLALAQQREDDLKHTQG